LTLKYYVKTEHGENVNFIITDWHTFCIELYNKPVPGANNWSYVYTSEPDWNLTREKSLECRKYETNYIFLHWVLTGLFNKHLFPELQIDGRYIVD
jgi:hypothetical protein